MTRTIQVDHLARVEGHGGITVAFGDGGIEKFDFDIFEGMRLFEGLVRGRRAEEVPAIVSRICAICSHGHSITSIAALENALGVEVTAQTRLLRDLGYQGANIQSHSLHVFCLAAPDLLGLPSVIRWAEKQPEVVATALRLKKLGNTIQEVVGGRAVHPVNYVLGGFGKVPSADQLVSLRDDLDRGLEDCQTALGVLSGLEIPNFTRAPLRLAAVVPSADAFFFGDQVRLSDAPALGVSEYRALTNEQPVPHSTAKHSAYQGRSYMVGALARLTLHGERIGGAARRAWEALGMRLPTDNVLMNDVAQAVEMIWSTERARAIVEELLDRGVADERPVPHPPRPGRGVAATEVPRGVLFHAYELDAEGRVQTADVITPTAQNLNHAETQFAAAIAAGRGLPDEELKRRLEIIARAYDPCISCSVHVLRHGTA